MRAVQALSSSVIFVGLVGANSEATSAIEVGSCMARSASSTITGQTSQTTSCTILANGIVNYRHPVTAVTHAIRPELIKRDLTRETNRG